MSPSTRHTVLDDYRVALQDMHHSVSAPHCRSDITVWSKWNAFTSWLGVAADLSGVSDPITILQIFAHRICSSVLAAKRQPIK